LRHVKFNYKLLSDEHEREGKLWYLVHWSITFVVNGSVCHYYENDKEDDKDEHIDGINDSDDDDNES
jgi:hypothetical protein